MAPIFIMDKNYTYYAIANGKNANYVMIGKKSYTYTSGPQATITRI